MTKIRLLEAIVGEFIMRVKGLHEEDIQETAELVARFRVELSNLRRMNKKPNITAAVEELNEYVDNGFPVFIAENDQKVIIGYIVCRIDRDVVWAESLYVAPEYRRRGTASILYERAEQLARKLGSETVYNWVHPNNEKIISFLDKKGYNVLNLIEVRKSTAGEKINQKIRVDAHEFNY